jgi:FAD/FMN-containing dehydrogenase
MSLSSYQKSIIMTTTDVLGVPAKLDQIGYKIIADYVVGETDVNETRAAIRIAFEDDAVVYIYTGTTGLSGFSSSGAEITLCNVPDSVVFATVRALAA